MNLYIRRQDGFKHSQLSVRVTDAEGAVVGYVTPAVADFLVTSGAAMDLT